MMESNGLGEIADYNEDRKMIIGVMEDKENDESSKRTMFIEVIEPIEGIRSNLSKSDQIRGDRVRRFQHEAALPSEKRTTQ